VGIEGGGVKGGRGEGVHAHARECPHTERPFSSPTVLELGCGKAEDSGRVLKFEMRGMKGPPVDGRVDGHGRFDEETRRRPHGAR
jgi:hypothetical protein